MAEKILKTRIQLRYDTLANWTTNDPVLKAGEIAVVQIATKNIANQQMPPIMFKVGDGEKKFSELGWTSGLAADVYDWAKAANKPSYSYSEISGTPTIPTVGNGKITITQNGAEMGSFTVNQSGATTIEVKDTADTDTQYQLVLSGHTLKLQSKAKGGAWADVSGQSFTLPDNNTTYTFAEGTANGAFTVTPSGGTAQSIKIHGLGTAAYKAEGDFDAKGAAAGVLGISSDAASANTVYGAKAAASAAQTTANTAVTNAATAQKTADDHIADKENPHGVTKSQVGLGSVVNAGRDTTVTANSNNYITSGAVKTYVDNAVGAVKQFQYEVITGDLPTASASTMGKIYLKAHTHGASDSYDEWITIETGTTTKSYSWEKIGNTDIDLSGYVPTSRTVNGKALTGNISLSAADVGVNTTAFPGLNKVGTVTGIKMNGASKTIASDGSVDLGTVITAHQDISGKQDKLSTAQLAAANSGITAAKVEKYDGYESTINGKQAALNTTQLNAVNSGITSTKVTTYDGYANKISTLEGKAGLDKVGTVTSVSAGTGLKVTGTTSVAPKVEIDEDATFVFNCGDSSSNW